MTTHREGPRRSRPERGELRCHLRKRARSQRSSPVVLGPQVTQLTEHGARSARLIPLARTVGRMANPGGSAPHLCFSQTSEPGPAAASVRPVGRAVEDLDPLALPIPEFSSAFRTRSWEKCCR